MGDNTKNMVTQSVRKVHSDAVSNGVNVFDGYSKEYDEWYDKNKFVYLSEVEAIKKVMPSAGRGLEIGVGTGRFAEALNIPVGIDPSVNMLQLAKERGIKTFTGKGEDLPFRDRCFDFVLMAITLCFVSDADKVMEESKRVLKKNGSIIIGIVDKDSNLGKFYENKKRQGHRFYKKARFYSTCEIVKLMQNHGLTDIKSYQTIFKPSDQVKEVEEPVIGSGEGGFVVLSGLKL